MARRSTSGSKGSFWAIFGVLFVLGLIIKYWWVIVSVLAVVALGYGGVKWLERHQGRKAAAARARADVAARADYEHQQYLAGNPVGLYGQYPPPEL
ncbi:hypothetical protein ACFTSD_24220 [Nocardiaceae bacterium NPDC056970]